MKDYEWVPQWSDGSFWSLHKKGTGATPYKGAAGYIGYVRRAVSYETGSFYACLPGGKEVSATSSMNEAGKLVESWAKETK